MNKEPIGLYIFRFVIGLAIFALMGLLYWSSTLVEENLKMLRTDISQLKNDLFILKGESERSRADVLKTLLEQQNHCLENFQKKDYSTLNGNNTSLSIPQVISKKNDLKSNQIKNLLREDPFFVTTLPKMLGQKFIPQGVQHNATIGKPENLHPFSNWSQVLAWHDLCNVAVAKMAFGKYETLAPDMALKVEERINSKTGEPEFWIYLRDNVFWQPLKPSFFSSDVLLAPMFLRKNQVTADDFKFFYDVLMNPFVQQPGAVSLRTYYSSIKEIEVVDKLTFIVRWNTEEIPGPDGKLHHRMKYIAKELTGGLRPLAGFVYKYFANGSKIIDDDADVDTYRKNSVWAQNFAEHWAKNIIVSCGPWIFEGMSERQIKFKRNPDFYNPYAALSEATEIDFKDSPDNIWQEFKSNNLDTYALQPNQIKELQDFLQSPAYLQQEHQGAAIQRLDYVSRIYTYIGWNNSRSYFNNAKLRRAMTMAIDRQRIIQDILNGLGIEITGTFYRYSPAYDASITPWPYDTSQARRLLEEEGWYDSDGDGIIDKEIDGKRVPFSFALTYFVKNPISKAICEYTATALKKIGVDCHLNGVDLADLSAEFDAKSFDALCLSWALGTPPEDPRQLWHSSGAKEKGSSNAIGFANAEVDEIIERLDYEFVPEKRIALYHRFDAIIHAEQPYTFLFTPKTVFLHRQYLQNVFLPIDRQDLIPGANVAEPDPSIFWIKKENSKDKISR